MTYKERNEKMKSLLDKQFLDRLTEVAKLYGWSGDYTEIDKFIECLYLHINLETPDTTPYEIED